MRSRSRSCMFALLLLVLTIVVSGEASAQGPAVPPIGTGGSPAPGGGSNEPIDASRLPEDETYRETPQGEDLFGTDDLIASTTNERPEQRAGMTMPNTYEDPESGYAGVMLENSMRRMSSQLLGSPLSLFYLMMGQTDPGVADNFAKSTQHALLMVNNTYTHQIYEMEKEARMGTLGTQRAMERLACIRQERQKLIDQGFGDNWYKATAVCRGALDISQPTTGSAPGGASVGAAPPDARFTGQTGSAATLAQEAAVSCENLTDRLSFVEHYLRPGEQVFTPSRQGAQPYRFKPQEQFMTRFGDVYTGTPRNQPDRAAQFVYCVIPPKRADNRRQFFEHRNRLWRSFFKVLEERCKAAASQTSMAAQQYVPFDPAQRGAFWRVASTQLGNTFDFANYQFKPATIDIIYEMFIAKELRDITTEACTRRLGPDQPDNRIENLLQGSVRVGNRTIRVRDEHRVVFALLEFVTIGQMLDVASNWKEYLGTDENFQRVPPDLLRAQIYSRVADFVGVPSIELIEERKKRNLDLFRRFIDHIHQLGAEQTGRGGQGLVDAFSAAKEAKEGTIGSGLAGQGR